MLVLLGALTAFGPMSLDLYLPAFEAIATGFEVPVAAVGLTFSASLLGLGLGQLVYGPLSDRYGRKKPLVLGLLVFIVASIACSLAPNLEMLIAFRFLQALGGSAGIVLARAMVRDMYSGREMARIMSLVAMVFGLAPILAPSVGALILRFTSWRIIFVTLAVFGALCLLGVLRLRETLPTARRVDHSIVGAIRNYGFVFRQKGFIAPAIVAALNSMGLFAYISSSPRVYLEEFDFTSQQFALAFGVGALSFVTGAQVNSRLVHRLSISRLLHGYLAIQVAVGITGVIVVVAELSVGFVIATLALYQFCTGGITGNALAAALRPFAILSGTAAALLGLMQQGSASIVSAGLTLIAIPPALLLMIVLLTFSSLALTVTVVSRLKSSGAARTVDTVLSSSSSTQ